MEELQFGVPGEVFEGDSTDMQIPVKIVESGDDCVNGGYL